MGLKFKFLHFKSFLDLAEIEIAPITLIYGENSSGKSTIIECLRMIRQSGSSRINTSPRTNTKDDINLGEEKEILSKIKYDKNHDKVKQYPDLFNYHFHFINDQTSTYSKKYKIQRSEKALENIILKLQKMTNNEIFRSDNPDQKDFLTDGQLDDLKIVKVFTLDKLKNKFNYDWGVIEINGGAGFEYSLKKEIEKEQIEYDYEEFGDAMIEENNIIRGNIQSCYGVKDPWEFDDYKELTENNYYYSITHPKGDNHKIWFPLIKNVIKNSEILLNAIETAKSMIGYELPKKSFGTQQRQVIPFQGIPTNRLDELIIQINKLIDAHNEYIDDPRIDYNSPKDGILSLTKNELEKYYSFDFDKRCSDFCHFLFSDLESDSLDKTSTSYNFKHMLKGGWYGEYLSLETSLIEHLGRQLKIAVLDPILYFFLADRMTLEIFRRFKFISNIKKPASRKFLASGNNKRQLNNDASNLAEILFHDKKLLDHLNHWLSNSYFHCRLEVTEIMRDVFDIKVFDEKNKNSPGIPLKDSGSGIYNILPVITQSFISKDPSFIAIEEPEVTLHPKLQIALADFLANMTKEKENTYLIETHSEHLILNLLQLIKDGSLSHEWLNVYVTTKDNEGSHLHKMEINDKGEFTNPWPGGFFEDRENLLMK